MRGLDRMRHTCLEVINVGQSRGNVIVAVVSDLAVAVEVVFGWGF